MDMDVDITHRITTVIHTTMAIRMVLDLGLDLDLGGNGVNINTITIPDQMPKEEYLRIKNDSL